MGELQSNPGGEATFSHRASVEGVENRCGTEIDSEIEDQSQRIIDRTENISGKEEALGAARNVAKKITNGIGKGLYNAFLSDPVSTGVAAVPGIGAGVVLGLISGSAELGLLAGAVTFTSIKLSSNYGDAKPY